MFDQLKNRIAALERELAAVKDQIAELKTNFRHLTGENFALRQQNDDLKSFGIVPGKRIRRYQYPDYTEEAET
jgi:regulator of replication initiation timing